MKSNILRRRSQRMNLLIRSHCLAWLSTILECKIPLTFDKDRIKGQTDIRTNFSSTKIKHIADIIVTLGRECIVIQLIS